MQQVQETQQGFSFSEILDADFLSQYCDGDLDFCSDMFAAFLETGKQQIEELEQAIESRNYSTISAIAHKIKPNYSFVGLSADGSALAKIDKDAKAAIISSDINDIIIRIKNNIMIVESESSRLNKYLKENN